MATLDYFPVLTWYPYWTTARYGYDLDWLDLDFIDVISHYGIKPDPGSPGDIIEPTAGGEVTWPETELITKVHAAGKKIILLVGGAESGADAGFRAVCGHQGSGALRQDLVDNVMAIVDARNYDGVDIDWEYPGYSGIEIEVTGATVAALDDSTVEVAFALPGGAYATAVMREVMKNDKSTETVSPRVDDTPEAP